MPEQADAKDPKRVCIFTTFDSFSPAYSLCRIAVDQIKMLVAGGYHPTVIVQDGFEPVGPFAFPEVTLKYIPNVACHNEVKKDETFDEDVDAIEAALSEILKDIDVVISHDVIYQNAALKHNFASRRVAKKMPNLLWLHWIHSATSPVTLNALRPIFTDAYLELVQTPFPNSLYVFFNDYSVPRVARDFGVDQEKVRVVHHPSDIGEVLGLTKDVKKFAQEKGLYQKDVVSVYPCRLDRGKQVEMVIKTVAMLKDFDLSVVVIVVDFHSTGGAKLTYRDELKNIAIDWGLNSEELIFTSEANEDWGTELPYEDTMAIMRLGNVFIQASKSESYSLITQEAGILKNVVVLNQDFPPFRDIFGPDPIYKKYSSNFDVQADLAEGTGNTNTEYGPENASPDERKEHEKKYHRGTAGLINTRLKHPEMAFSTRLRKHRSLEAIFKKELEPLFFSEVKNG